MIEEIDKNKDQDVKVDSYKTIQLSGMYKNWFLDYASYVILERAVPSINDGLKPVQRRILHAMKEMDDGRYNKVAGIVGQTMKYHPHGDASIGDALVQLGQKDLMIDMQGNWGNILTGDRAAASRYIEARLSKFALEVAFNNKTTNWGLSYDGRNNEPINLPVKFPLLLAQGVEGIAVGLASKILPYNFNELIDASIKILKNEEFQIYPDFCTGGMADVSKYSDGLKGEKIKVRAKISKVDNKTLIISEIPFGTTTTALIDTIISANDKGKIKIKKIDDNTAQNVEILIHLPNNVSIDTTIDALYSFTNCEISLSPNSCIIEDNKPKFLSVNKILIASTNNTLGLLKKELEIRKSELMELLFFASLEKIFIENRIYIEIENCKTWDAVIETIDNGLKPFKTQFYREITKEDIAKLTEIKIKRISKYNSFKAEDIIKNYLLELEKINFHLANLVQYAIDYFIRIKEKYGKGRDRKTELRNFETINASQVAAANKKLYVDYEEGFIGTSLKKNEYVCDCSDIDEIIVFRLDGSFIVTKVSEKIFVGKKIIYLNVFNRNDDRTIYNLIYRDGKSGYSMVKRFAVKSITRDREYPITKGNPDSKILYFSANHNGEAEIVKVVLRPKKRLKKLIFDFDFSDVNIKGRSSYGNIITRHPVKKISKKVQGVSTLGAIDIWFEDSVKRINVDKRGRYLGAFKAHDEILTINKSGSYQLFDYSLNNHFDDDLVYIEKFNPKDVISVIYSFNDMFYVKRFDIDENTKKHFFIDEDSDSEMLFFSLDKVPQVEISFLPSKTGKEHENEIINITEFIGVKSYKARGKKLSYYEIDEINMLEPLVDENIADENINDENLVQVSTDDKNDEENIIENNNTEEKVFELDSSEKSQAIELEIKEEEPSDDTEKLSDGKAVVRKNTEKEINETEAEHDNNDDEDDNDSAQQMEFNF